MTIIGSIGIFHFIVLSSLLFTIGTCGIFISRKSVITILMSIELMLLSVNINFVAFSVHSKDISGQIFTIAILTVAAAEAAIGLAILVAFYRNRHTIDVSEINKLKG